MYRVLIVEDNSELNEGIAWALREEGYEPVSALCVDEAFRRLNPMPDLTLLDINLPDGDGRDFLKALRRISEAPVILLTARDTEGDMLKGFDYGCDDYITKPFSMPVLLKRMKAVLKRAGGTGEEDKYTCGTFTWDFYAKELLRNGQTVSLTATEIRLLEYFLKNPNRVLTRQQILEAVWDTYENYVDEGTLNVNIRRLREKVEEDAGHPVHIRTMFGVGYQWNDA